MPRASAILFVLVVCAAIGSAQPATNDANPTITLTSRYSIDIDYHNFFKFFGGEILGIAPDELVYTETILPNGDRKQFSMRLTENGNGTWFLIDSDTLIESFTHLPSEEKKAFDAAALQFVTHMRDFLMCQDSCDDFLQGTFRIDSTHILAMLSAQQATLVVLDEDDELIRGTPLRMVAAHTRNAMTTDPYIIGDIVVEVRDGHIIYPYVAALLFEKNIKIKLYLKGFTVEYR